MGGQKLLWILLGLSLAVLVAARSSQVEYEVDDEMEEDDDDDDECDPDCEKSCDKLKCASGRTTRDSCGCCECKLAEGGMAPKIVSPPEHVRNYTGGSAAMSCEVIGDPIPLVSWVKTNVNNKTSNLPGDDDSIMTLSQGGPEKHEVTGWLQIMHLRKSHEADYTCVAYNKHGSDTRTARLKINKRSKRHQRHAKKE